MHGHTLAGVCRAIHTRTHIHTQPELEFTCCDALLSEKQRMLWCTPVRKAAHHAGALLSKRQHNTLQPNILGSQLIRCSAALQCTWV
mmetsp:Transcript_12049/g.31715  ORF Transcript_12049/g.31715 Transcript_12049/m.31715 type:complete len:87 (-) Transcript_12049:190-450(-)